MAPWTVFYRPREDENVIRSFGQLDTTRSRFKLPLSSATLDDPAFSPDPRSNPHFPIPNVASYKALPPKISHPLPASPPRTISPRMPLPDAPPSHSPSLSSESDPLSSFSPFTSPTLSSGTSHSQSPTHSRGSPSPVSLLSLSPSNPVSPPSTHPNVILEPPPHFPVPKIPPKSDSTNTLTRNNLKPVALQNTNVPRKGRMKTLIRRLTSRHSLDRIDELDETDPSGVSYHHGGPYEAIGSNLAQPSLPRRYSDTASRRGNMHHSKQREVCQLACPHLSILLIIPSSSTRVLCVPAKTK